MATEDKEFGNLIGSEKVEGTTGDKIGSIERVMLDKKSGQLSLRRARVRWLSGDRA